ncbi:MAG: cation diffusion facilitator family transporter [Anaerolineales bacterium]
MENLTKTKIKNTPPAREFPEYAESAEDLRNLGLTLGLYLLIFALKLAAYFASGVMALLAESLHTLSDIFVSGFLLIAAVYSRRGADSTHMFGHGRAQNAAALVAATLFISFTSLELFREAVPHLLNPVDREYQNLPLALGVLVVSMVIAGIPLLSLMRGKAKGPAAKAQFLELINDELGLLAALGGTVFLVFGWPQADPLAAIFVATIIAVNGVGLFRENLSFLLGRSPGKEFMDRIRATALDVPGVLGVHNLRAEIVGNGKTHVVMHILVPRGITIERADAIAGEVHKRIHLAERPGYCVIHAESEKTE